MDPSNFNQTSTTPNPISNPTPDPTPDPTPMSTPNPVPSQMPSSMPGSVPNGMPSAMGGVNMNPVNPVVSPTNLNNPGNPTAMPEGIGATEPIMMPEPAAQPDPVEEELKAPMRAADPVPGSIGSAVSGPGQTVNASVTSNPFNNPVSNTTFGNSAPQNNIMQAQSPKKMKAKTNKSTMIALIAVVAVIIVVLVVILVMQLAGGGIMGKNGTDANIGASVSDSVVDQVANEPEDKKTGLDNREDLYAASTTLSCARNMTVDEMVEFGGSGLGVISIETDFDENDELKYVSMVRSEIYTEEKVDSKEEVKTDFQEALAGSLSAEDAGDYYLPVGNSGEVELSFDVVQDNFEALDFVCEVL